MSKKKKISKLQQVLFMTTQEFALVIGVSPRQVWRLNAMGKLPKPIRLGGSVKWKISEVADWIDSNCPDLQTWEAMKEAEKSNSNGEDNVK